MRDVEVCVDGGRYSVVPADLEPGGGFCVSLDRDFVGETNMASMLYVRKKGGAHVNGDVVGKEGLAAAAAAAGEEEEKEEEEKKRITLPSKVILITVERGKRLACAGWSRVLRPLWKRHTNYIIFVGRK